MKQAILAKGLTKSYEKFKLDDVTISIPQGFASVIIGSNGAGKTTLLKVLAGLASYESGEIKYHDIGIDPKEVTKKAGIGFVPDSNMFPDQFYLETVKKFMTMGFEDFDKERFDRLCMRFRLLNMEGKKISEMSLGSKMKIMLCAQFARNTKILMLDEPASSLDPLMQDILQDLMREYLKDEQHTILYSTHNIDQVKNVVDYAVFMDNGHILETGFIDDLMEKYCIIKGDVCDQMLLKPYVSYLECNNQTMIGFGLKKQSELFNRDSRFLIETPDLKELSVFLLKKEILSCGK